MKLKRKVNIHKVKGIQAIMDYHQFCFINRILLLPTPAGLPIMAKAALAILAFAVIMWVTEAVSSCFSCTYSWIDYFIIRFKSSSEFNEKLGNPKSGDAILKGSELLGTNNALFTCI